MVLSLKTETPAEFSSPIGELEVLQRPVSERAIGSTVMGCLTDEDLRTLELPAGDYYRQQVVEAIIDLAKGEADTLSAEDFMPKTEVVNLPTAFERAVFVPKVTVQKEDLRDILPLRSAGDITCAGLDVFPKDSRGQSAIRLIDLRDQTGLSIDRGVLNQSAIAKKLDERFVHDVAQFFVRPNAPTVRIADQTLFYSKSSADKLRTWYRVVETDPSVQTDGYKIYKTIVRLADAATEKGERQIFKQLLGKEM